MRRLKLNTSEIIRRLSIVWLLVLLSGQAAAAGEWQIDDTRRVVAISDIHGAYAAMLLTLASAGVIDDQEQWIGGDAHLVITGDLLDRGPDSRKVMELIMMLEQGAAATGGSVHQLIGNHEVMNLVGDLRYVSREEYAAFADEESAEEREHWFQQFRSRLPEGTDEAEERARFDEQAPPGFFAHRRAFRPDGRYGAWLLSKPLMLVINRTAFVHGGISPYVAEHGLDGVNGTLASELRRYVDNLVIVEDAGLLSPLDSFYDHAKLLQALPEDTILAPDVRAAVDTVIDLNASQIHGPDSPLWYRGSVGCSELIEGDRLAAALLRIGADRAVIGHTPTLTRHVLQRLGGRIIEIDTGMLAAAYHGTGNALVIDGDTLTAVNEHGGRTSPPAVHPRRVGIRPGPMDAAELAKLLSGGQVTGNSLSADGRTVLQVSQGDTTVSAWFDPRPGRKEIFPELAAYRLDRSVGLDMVPVTVRYEYQGEAGSLQYMPPSTSDEQQRAASGRGASAWCPLPDQWNALYIYDVLIGNEGRLPTNMLYSTDNWQLILTGHGNGFSSSRKRPRYLQDSQLVISSYWVQALKSLDRDAMTAEFGDVLDKRQITALLKRRDLLLEDAAATE